MLFKITTAGLAATAMANWAQIQTDVSSILTNHTMMYNLAVSASGNGDDADRALTQSDMAHISEYGCWCFFESTERGKGQPIDDIDAQCKQLQDGYFCAVQDAVDIGEVCTPWEIIYNSSIGIGLGAITVENVVTECNAANPGDQCANAACKIEGWFVVGFLRKIVTGSIVNQDYRHSNGFVQDDMCPLSGNGIKSEKSCCGEHPMRFPFKNYDGARDCCDGHTFNTNLYTCCADGTVKISC